MIGGILTGTELLYIVYLKNSVKIMRVGRLEWKSSRISIPQLVQRDRVIKQRGISRMPNFLSKQTDMGDSFGLYFSASYPWIGALNSDDLSNLILLWVQ